ncbi:hypothetical protein [Vibrio hibernica]|uniref:hypothetical protein n=1 Tax=Vibrio hibernica TaxID=2587465 RepID=UPI0039B0885C
MFTKLRAARKLDKASKIIHSSGSFSANQIRYTNDLLRDILIHDFPHPYYIANTTPEALAAYYYGVMANTKCNDDPQYANALAIHFYELIGELEYDSEIYHSMGAVFFSALTDIKKGLEINGITAESLNPISQFLRK